MSHHTHGCMQGFQTVSTQPWGTNSVWTWCTLYSEIAACLHQVISLPDDSYPFSVTGITTQKHFMSLWGVLWPKSWNLCACVSGLHCSFVRVKYEVSLWWCDRSNILRNLDNNIEWNNISSFSWAFNALLSLMYLVWGISHYPKLLQCWLRPGVFSWIYVWLPCCGGTEGVIQSRWFSWAVVSMGSW